MLSLATRYLLFFTGGSSIVGGSGGGGSVALKADYSDPNANEAWVFW